MANDTQRDNAVRAVREECAQEPGAQMHRLEANPKRFSSTIHLSHLQRDSRFDVCFESWLEQNNIRPYIMCVLAGRVKNVASALKAVKAGPHGEE